MKNASFPIFLKVEKFHMLVIGGGHKAARTLAMLMNRNPQPQVTLVAPEIGPEVEALAITCPDLSLVRRRFIPSDLLGVQLAIIANGDELLNEGILQICKKNGILVSSTTLPDLSDFSLKEEAPDIVEKIGTGVP